MNRIHRRHFHLLEFYEDSFDCSKFVFVCIPHIQNISCTSFHYEKSTVKGKHLIHILRSDNILVIDKVTLRTELLGMIRDDYFA